MAAIAPKDIVLPPSGGLEYVCAAAKYTSWVWEHYRQEKETSTGKLTGKVSKIMLYFAAFYFLTKDFSFWFKFN